MTLPAWLDGLFTGTGLLEPLGFHPEIYVLYVLALVTVGLLWVRKSWRHRSFSDLLAWFRELWRHRVRPRFQAWVRGLSLKRGFASFLGWFRGPWRDRILAGSLALFWMWIAFGASRDPYASSVRVRTEVVAALLQAAGLLFAGVIRRRLRFAGRRGPWPVLGGALLAYALAIHPLLGRIVPGGLFGASFLGLPFPPLVFTLGLLFFLDEPYPRAILAIPLLWAAAGGSAPELGAPHLWALRAVFVAGCGFVCLPQDVWKTHWRVDSKNLYRSSLKSRRRLERCLAALVLGTLGYLFLLANGTPLPDWLDRLAWSLGLLGLGLLGFWLAFPAWLSPGFRLFAWAVARAGGWLWNGLRATWRWALLLAVASVLVYDVGLMVKAKEVKVEGQRRVVFQVDTKPNEALSALQWQVRFLAAAILAGLIQMAYSGRKRLVIEPFADCTSGDAGGKDGKEKDAKKAYPGIDSELRNSLGRISDLYRVIDEFLPKSTGGVVQVTVDVRDVGDILKDSAGTGSAFKIWGLEIPANFFFSLVSRLVRGPRITGSVHGTGNDLFIVAELSGGGRRETWRVDPGDLGGTSQKLEISQVVGRLVDQLAYRITTQLVAVGSPRWSAVRRFTEGLRQYRESQHTTTECDIKLREAEMCLLEAVRDDGNFVQCHYNLGIVYRRLSDRNSATSAFRKAIEADPGHYEACYALAETHVDMRDYEEACWVCDSAIGIDPADARAWDLKAYAIRQQEQSKCQYKFALPHDHPAWEKISACCQQAAALSWRKLCRLTLSGVFNPEEWRQSALVCTTNLAVVLGRMKDLPESEQVFRQAVRLVARDASTQVSFAKALYWSDRWDESERVLTEVFDDGLDLGDRTALWSILTRVRASRAAGEDPNSKEYGPARAHAKQAFHRLLDVMVSLGEGDSLEGMLHILADTTRNSEEEAQKIEKEVKKIEDAPADLLIDLGDVRRALLDNGLGFDADGLGWIRLAIRLCRFLRVLEGEKDDQILKPLKRLQAALASNGEGGIDLEGLEHLRTALAGRRQGSGEGDIAYLDRLRKEYGRALPPLEQAPGETAEGFATRAAFYGASLQVLGLKTETEGPGWVISGLLRLQAGVGASNPTAPDRVLLEDCIRDAQRYLEWAECQIFVKEATLCLEAKLSGPDYRKLAVRAVDLLERAIHSLEAWDSTQPRGQKLYGLLAQAHARLAQVPERSQDGEIADLRVAQDRGRALAYSEYASEINPEGAHERLLLVEVYSSLRDYRQAKEEAEIALSFDNGSEALNKVGSSFWQRAEDAESRRTRKEVLREAVDFFKHALQLIESQAFDADGPLAQMKSHAWAHHWLGRFHCELMEHEKGIGHQEVAKSMGFKPLESQVNLAWAHLENRSYAKAEAAFREARAAADRLSPEVSLQEALQAQGEERPLGELLIDLCLGWALLQAERGLRPDAAFLLAQRTETLVTEILAALEATKRRSLQASLHETLAWIHLKVGQKAECVERAKRSLRFGFRSGAYLCLARAALLSAKPTPAELRQAREACRDAKQADLRGRYRWEIHEVLCEIRRLEGESAKGPAAPPPHPAG